jgi:hypothetical protein
MVEPDQVERILSDAIRLLGEGELVVFGSAALAVWLRDPPASRDVDLLCAPAEKGEILTAMMGELSWYHEKHGVFVEVWSPETFAAPSGWRERARLVVHQDHPGVRLLVPHPHDVLVSKLERMETKDRDHVRRILAEYPLTAPSFDDLANTAPQRSGAIVDAERRRRFEHGASVVRAQLGSRDPRG